MEWVSLRMPFEAANLRVELAAAHRATGDDKTANFELDAACRVLQDIGAAPWAELARGRAPADSVQQGGGARGCVFRCQGDTRTITFAGKTVLVKDLKGMRYLERLLSEPAREFHALDLVTVERGALPTRDARSARIDPGCGLEVFDSKAREAYRQRLAEVDEDIAEAEAHNDFERVELARADRQFLVDELCRGVGLNDRERTVGGGAERARTSTTRSLRYALARIAQHHAALAEHLDRTIRTGTYFTYEPDPRVPVEWET